MNNGWTSIEEVRNEAITCCRCDLCYTRKHVVFGEGNSDARIMIVGEGPGGDEDRQGRPFVGRSGKLLDSVLQRAGLGRNDVWITNVVRCRPVLVEDTVCKNRPPRTSEVAACDIWMSQELRFVAPDAIVCLGAVSAQALTGRTLKLTQERGKWQIGRDAVEVMPTYHPAYILRLSGEQRAVSEQLMIEDIRQAMMRMSRRNAA